MSRIGKLPVAIPAGVKVTVADGLITVEGPKGKLTQPTRSEVAIEVKDNEVIVTRHDDEMASRSCHGLYRQLIHNMIIGVSQGFTKVLVINGVGYRAAKAGKKKQLAKTATENIVFFDIRNPFFLYSLKSSD